MSDKKFRIITAWSDEGGGGPWLLSAYCEVIEDEWGGTPDFFTKAVGDAKAEGSTVREVEILTDYDAICERFNAGVVDGEVAP